MDPPPSGFHFQQQQQQLYPTKMKYTTQSQQTKKAPAATRRSCPSALLGAPTATTVSTPPVGVHRCRQAAADGMYVE